VTYFLQRKVPLCFFSELHLPSAPTTSEAPPPEPEEDGDGESGGADEENLVPVEGERTADGDNQSLDDQQRQQEQQKHPSESTKKPPQTAHGGGSGNGGSGGGGVRHHDNKQRHGSGKGSGSECPARWLLVLAAVVVVTLFRSPVVSRW